VALRTRVGETFAHYRIEERLGAGGSGVVYRARDLRLERPVALKVLSEALRDDELAWARLLREARLASSLRHPHICAIHDLGEEDGRSYIAMEHIDGLPLADALQGGALSAERVRDCGAQIAAALAHAHEHGVIHGDLKSRNVMITAEGDVKLVDFGLGRRIPRQGMEQITSSHLALAEVGATAGTLPYLAPELLRGEPSSIQSDVWALGVLLYEMAAGELPFKGSTPFELTTAIMVATPASLDGLPQPLGAVIRRCIEKDPAGRYASARQVQQAIETEAPASTSSASGKLSEPSFLRIRRARLAAAGGAVLLLLVILALTLAHYGLFSRSPLRVHPSTQSYPLGNPAAKVWVNTRTGTYHCPETTWYGKTKEGIYMTQKDAQAKGYRPAANKPCL
jgi:serine/threonine protein kinase